MTDRLYTIEQGTSARAVSRLMALLFPDAVTVLDTTFGSGSFWKGCTLPVQVTGLDINPERARDVCADFTRLPFADSSFDVVVFDPPYQWDMGRGKASVMGGRFGSYQSEQHARETIQGGAAEAWRVARLGLLVKVQNHIHASRLVHMTRWVEDAVPSPLYDELHLTRRKMVYPKWRDQLSVYRNHATFMAFRQDGPVHRARKAAV